MFSSIVAGTDGSPTARKAVQVAADLARLSGASLHLVSGYRLPNPIMAAYVQGVPSVVPDEDAESEVRAMLEATPPSWPLMA